VDEVLAVGDAMFQSKCLGKMQDVAKSGRTVLFVSHNMGAVETLCTKGLVISSGQIVANTTSKEAIQIYLREMETASDSDLAHRTDRSGVGRSQLQSIEITAGKDFKEKTLVTGDPARFTYYINYTFPGMIAVVSIYDTNGQAVVDFRSRHSGDGDYLSAQLHNKFICETDELLLAPGRYRMDIEIYCSQELQDHVTGAIYFDVAPGNIRGRMTSAPIRHAKAMMPNRWILPLKGSI
ncbi:MAG: ABC transporter ATP-binding protein, partial [Blastopirellula sp.]